MNHMKRIGLSALVIFVAACSRDEDTVHAVQFNHEDQLDKIELTATADVPARFTWTSTGVTINDSDKEKAWFALPEGEDNKQITITLTAKGKYGKPREASRAIEVPGKTTVRKFGIGKTETISKSVDADHSWYYDQFNTGPHSMVNCGPSVVTMAVKWYNKDFTKTPEDARMKYRSGGGWWFTSDILNYLYINNVPHNTIALTSIHRIRDEIDAGNIVILCLDMYKVSFQRNDLHRVNKFYQTTTTDWGHFILIKGYVESDGVVYYEAYDPYSLGRKYTDGQLKGQGRYYLASDLDVSTNYWWDNAIVVSKTSKGGRHQPLDAARIVHASGQ